MFILIIKSVFSLTNNSNVINYKDFEDNNINNKLGLNKIIIKIREDQYWVDYNKQIIFKN